MRYSSAHLQFQQESGNYYTGKKISKVRLDEGKGERMTNLSEDGALSGTVGSIVRENDR
jgi:hypothetical protein